MVWQNEKNPTPSIEYSETKIGRFWANADLFFAIRIEISSRFCLVLKPVLNEMFPRDAHASLFGNQRFNRSEQTKKGRKVWGETDSDVKNQNSEKGTKKSRAFRDLTEAEL